MKYITLAVSGVTGVLSFIFGGFDQLIITLLILLVVDYVTGLLKALYNKQLNSEIGAKGIIKKVMIILAVTIAVIAQTYINMPLREIIISFFILNEIISVIENIGEVITLPKVMYDVLEQLKLKRDDTIRK